MSINRIYVEGPKRHSLGVILEGGSPIPSGCAWNPIHQDGSKVGDMTTCAWSYRMKTNIGFALISTRCKPGEAVEVVREGMAR